MFDITAFMHLLREERKLEAQSKISNKNNENRRHYYQRTLNQISQTRERGVRNMRTRHK